METKRITFFTAAIVLKWLVNASTNEIANNFSEANESSDQLKCMYFIKIVFFSNIHLFISDKRQKKTIDFHAALRQGDGLTWEKLIDHSILIEFHLGFDVNFSNGKSSTLFSLSLSLIFYLFQTKIPDFIDNLLS